MPRLNKDGSHPISKPVAEARAEVHRSVVGQIDAVLAEAVRALPGPADYPTGPDRMSRLAGDLIQHYASMLYALRDLSADHEFLGHACSKAALRRKPGRPAIAVPDGMLWSGMQKAVPVAKKSGRPTLLGPKFDARVYEKVEQRRNQLRNAGKAATIKAALESLFDDRSKATGIRLSRLISESYSRYRAAYGRGRNLVPPA